MNEEGARAESAAAMGFKYAAAAIGPPPYVIDRPFILWMEKEGVTMPLFVGVFAEDSWKDPRSLE
jgi:serine protease inhibitor